jgi:hypothetical protein
VNVGTLGDMNEDIFDDILFLIGECKNAQEPHERIYRINGLVDKDIEWLNTRLREQYADVFVEIGRIIGSNEYMMDVRANATMMRIEQIALAVHNTTGPHGTLFTIDPDQGEDDDEDDPPDDDPPSDEGPFPSYSDTVVPDDLLIVAV